LLIFSIELNDQPDFMRDREIILSTVYVTK
jgi:hypothetical protein